MTLGGRRFLLGLAVLAASLSLALGLSMPAVRLTRIVSFSDQHSLISAVNALVRSGQLLLGAAILLFAIFLPLLKLLYLLLLTLLPLRDIERLAGQLRALEWLGKWSLMDVLVLASTIVLINGQGAWNAASAGGIYFFAGSVLLMLLAQIWLRGDAGSSRLRGSKAAYSSTMRGSFFLLLLVAAAACLALGLLLPAIRLDAAYAGASQHSLATVIWALYAQQAFYPCLVLFTLAVLLPCLKLFYLLALVVARLLPYSLRVKSIAVLEWLGRYSTTEVMVLALMLFYLTGSGHAADAVLPGAYFFAASVLLTMLAYAWANAPGSATTAGGTGSLQARLAEIAARAGRGEPAA